MKTLELRHKHTGLPCGNSVEWGSWRIETVDSQSDAEATRQQLLYLIDHELIEEEF